MRITEDNGYVKTLVCPEYAMTSDCYHFCYHPMIVIFIILITITRDCPRVTQPSYLLANLGKLKHYVRQEVYLRKQQEEEFIKMESKRKEGFHSLKND